MIQNFIHLTPYIKITFCQKMDVIIVILIVIVMVVVVVAAAAAAVVFCCCCCWWWWWWWWCEVTLKLSKCIGHGSKPVQI
jgi:hypothetical protein